MNYQISDLIQKLIDIEKDILRIYKEIESIPSYKFQPVGVMAKVIRKEEEKHVKYYENLLTELTDNLNEAIEFYLYDRVAKLLYEFKARIYAPKIKSVQDLIKYSIELKKNIIGLLLDIQGRLLEKIDDVNNNIYKVFTKIIKEEKRYEMMFEQLIIIK